ncbi:MAG: phosphate acyltransferase, partial [Alphaproteobacteria bacterium]
LSVGNVLKAKSLKKMAKSPIILALANPTPEVDPNEARKERPDAIIATGRSDFPNQVNNVLCFPFIFRGALDVGATTINDEMKMACVRALAALAKAEASDVVVSAYGDEDLQFGPEYIIPKPFDPRLIVELSSAVAKAAMDTGVATRPIEDFSAYRQKLAEFVFKSGMVMRPILDRAAQDKKRLVFADGEEFRVLRAIQIIVDEGLAFPIIIGRADVVKHRIKSLGLRLKKDKDYELVDPQDDPRYKDYWTTYHSLLERQGVSPDYAKIVVRTNTSVIAALMVHKKQADAMLAGPIGRFRDHLNSIIPVLDLKPGVRSAASMTALITGKGNFFFCDPYVNYDPSSTELAEIAIQAAEHVRSFGLEPKVALLCHSNFGSTSFPTAQKMQQTLQHIRQLAPELEVEGEMHADAALEEKLREQVFPKSQLKGQANLLVMPNMDAANIAFNLSKCIGEGQSIGPILLGLDLPAHIITSSASVRSIVNMAAIAVVEAQLKIQNNGAFRNPNQSQVA